MEQRLVGRQPRGGELGQGHADLLEVHVAGDLLHRDQPDAPPVGQVQGPVHRVVLGGPGVVLEHDHVDEPAGRGRLDEVRPHRVVGREADKLRLARLADRLGSLLELAAPGPARLDLEVLLSQGVEEEQVDVIGLERLEPLVELPEELRGRIGPVLGHQEELVARHGGRLHPPADHRLGAVGLGRVDITDAVGPGEAEQPLAARAHPGAEGEHRHIDPRAAQLAAGERPRRIGDDLGRGRGGTPRIDGRGSGGRPVASRLAAGPRPLVRRRVIPDRGGRGEPADPLLEEIPTIHPPGQLHEVVAHRGPPRRSRQDREAFRERPGFTVPVSRQANRRRRSLSTKKLIRIQNSYGEFQVKIGSIGRPLAEWARARRGGLSRRADLPRSARHGSV